MKRFCLLFLCLMMCLTVLPAGAQEPEIYHSDDGDVRIMVENQKFDDVGASGLRNDDSDFTIVDGVLTAYNGSGGYVDIPWGVEAIADSVFEGNTSITDVDLPYNLKTIGKNAFKGCTGLKYIWFPDSLTSIGEGAFSGTGLTYLYEFGGIKVIPSEAFSDCRSLSTIEIPEGLEQIQANAFRNTGLQVVTIPKSVTFIDDNAFANSSINRIRGYAGSAAQRFAEKNNINFIACGGYTNEITFSGPDKVYAGFQIAIHADTDNNPYKLPAIEWSLSDDSIASLSSGYASGVSSEEYYYDIAWITANEDIKKETKLTVTATARDDKHFSASYDITILPMNVNQFSIFNMDAENVTGKTLDLDAASPYESGRQIELKAVTADGSKPNITWTSSDDSVASVSTDGWYGGADNEKGSYATVTAKKVGNVTITASYVSGGKTVKSSVKINAIARIQSGGIVISGPDTLTVGKKAQFTYTLKPQAIEPTNKEVVWHTSDASILKMSDSGLATPLKAAKNFRISACPLDNVRINEDGKRTFYNCSFKYVNIEGSGPIPDPAVKISILDENNKNITGKTVELDAAAKETLLLHVQGEDGSVPSVTWKSSAAKAASVDGSGLVKALKPGTAKITASYKSGKKTISATVTVKVVSKVIGSSIILSGPENIATGKTAKFTAKIVQTPAPTNKKLVWFTTDEKKATVNASGTVKAIAAAEDIGIVVCAQDSKATDPSGKVYYQTCTSRSVSITQAAESVKIEVIGGTTTLDAGETVTLKAVIRPAAAGQSVDWTPKTSSKVADIKVNADGTLTVRGKAKGSITIKATTTDGSKKSDSVKLTVGVKVKDGMLDIKGVKDTLAVKKTMKLTAVFKPVPSNKKVEWSILEGADLITLKNGTVKAIAPGHAKVQVCSLENPSVCKAAEFDVISPVTSVKLDPNKAQTLDIGGGFETLTLKATVLPANATKPELEWKSSKPNVATVDENGVVTPVGVGSTVITATATDGSKKSAKLTVKVVSKVQDGSLEIVGDTHELGLKQTTTLKVKFNQENAPANQKVTWKSSAPKIASVSAKGVVKGLKVGEVTITAASADNKTVKATWNITVGESVKADEMPEIAALVDALLAETEEVTVEPTTETIEPTAVETEEGVVDEPEMEQTPKTVEETPEGEENLLAVTPEPEETYEEEPVVAEVIESEDEIAVVYESEDADSLMTEESESGLGFGESLIDAEGVDVVIRDLGESDALSGEVNGVISIARERFELSDELFSGLVFTVEDESVAKLTEQSVDAGIELQLLKAGETKLIIKQVSSGEILREIRLVVTAAPAAEEPVEEELPAEEVLTESVETLESGEPTVDEEAILVETDAELVFSNEPEE